jgi:formylglycine-generating enzyme required for sulfatase activity
MKHFLLTIFLLFALTSTASANNLVISNLTLEDRNASANTLVVQFDISWDHSWRKADGRHDAAWVFFKIQDVSNTSVWYHAKAYTAGTNPSDTSVGSNSDLKIVIPSDKMGAFISRQATGNGTFSSKKVKLTLDYGTPGIADTVSVQVKTFGIEMVYIPEGPFYVGENDNPYNAETLSGVQGLGEGFISKFTSNGSFQWAKRLGGSGADNIYSISADSNNSVIAVGSALRGADLNGDGDTTDTSENFGAANEDIFVSDFTSTGTFQWAKRLGGSDIDFGYKVATDTSNNVIVTGRVRFTADLNGDGDYVDTNEVPSGVYSSSDAFTSVFNSSGTFQWSKRLGGLSTDEGLAVATDLSNNIIVAGTVNGSGDLTGDGDTADSGETGTTGPYAGIDAFISVFNSAGTFQWAKRLGGTSSDEVDCVTTDTLGNVIATGIISRAGDLNGDGDSADSNESTGGVYDGNDTFVAVFNSAGTFQWAERLGGTSIDNGLGCAVTSSNNVIVAGRTFYSSDLNGDGDTADSNETGGSGIYNAVDIFISAFNSVGTFQWSKRLGGTGTDYGYAVTVDNSSNINLTGYVTESADLNGDGDTTDSNESTGGVYISSDIFISVFDSSGTFQWAKRLGGTTTEIAYGVDSDSNNSIILAGSVTDNSDLNGDAAITSTYALYSPGAFNSAAQITTSGKSISTYLNSNDDIDTSPTTVTGLAGITGNTSWPNGYAAFYLMKYELSQGQYVDFLNTLSRVQQGNRVAATVSGNTIANYYVMPNTTIAPNTGSATNYRNSIRAPASGNGTTPTTIVFGNDYNANGTFNEGDDGQAIAMNYLGWTDIAAYADWAGLRPYTEMEFEKAAHGPTDSTSYLECAWGSSTTTIPTSIVNTGRTSEALGQSGEGLVNYYSVLGPVRSGFAATNATNRKSSGAGYYGNMDLSGNLSERTVTLGNSTGRSFTGTHGDGTLTTTATFEGNATNTDWPGINGTTNKGVSGATGAGYRGGNFVSSETNLSVAYRGSASQAGAGRDDSAARLARTAP